MSFLGFLTGFNECFESQWRSIRRFPGSVFAYPVLAYLEPQEVEPPISLMLFQCMSYHGFARLHFQADFPEPCFRPLFCLVDLLQGWAENDEVVRIAHDLGVGRQSAVVSLTYLRFQSMKGNIGKERAHDATLGCSFFCWREGLPLHHSCFEAAFNVPSH